MLFRSESEGVLIAYASIHGGTAVAAERLGEILREKGEMNDINRSKTRATYFGLRRSF